MGQAKKRRASEDRADNERSGRTGSNQDEENDEPRPCCPGKGKG
jgi:hypothetical protein